MKIDGRVVFSARGVGRTAWRIAWTLLASIAVLPAFLVEPYPALWQRLAMIPVYALTWGLPVWIGLLTLWSVNRYADITVTDEVLRVGREVLPLDRLDPRQVRARLAALTGPAMRSGAVGEDLEPVRVRHMGGAFGSTLGVPSVVVGLRDRQGLRIDARDPSALLSALASVLPAD